LTEVFGLEEGDVESRPSGSPGTDIMMSAKARKKIGVSFECKNTTGTPSRSQLEQSRANKIPGTLAGVVWKPRGHRYDKSLVIFDFDEFIAWVKERTDNVAD